MVKSFLVTNLFSNIGVRINLALECNLSCLSCTNDGIKNSETNFVDTELVMNLFKILNKLGFRKIVFSGGEPTLHPDIRKILEDAKEKFTEIWITTNGTDPNLNQYIKYLTRIHISLHSFNFKSWSFITHGSEDLFVQVIKNINSIKNKELWKQINQIAINNLNVTPNEVLGSLEKCNKFNFNLKMRSFYYQKPHFKKYFFDLGGLDINKFNLTPLNNSIQWYGNKYFKPFKRYRYKKILVDLEYPFFCYNKTCPALCREIHSLWITPDLKIKPCFFDEHTIDLRRDLRNKDINSVRNKIIKSRKKLNDCPLNR